MVTLFRVDLKPSDEVVAACRGILSDDELRRADRFVTADLTRRFSVCRAVLRQVLARVSHQRPEALMLVTGPHGKPGLANPGSPRIEFNVSHTGDVALIAVTTDRALGVDVEAVGRDVLRDELASRYFSAREREIYFSLPEVRRTAGFFRIWTCKEAYLKAIGAGLSLSLGHFSVSGNPDEPPGLLHVDDRPEEVQRWSFLTPDVGPDIAAALVVEGHGWTVDYQIWDHRTEIGSKIERE